MGLKFNVFTGNFDQTGSGGGGSSYIDGEVQNFSALPETLGSPAVDSAYLVREAEGAWLLNRKPAGIYIRTANTGVRASDWTYAGEFPDVFNDANFVLYDNGDSTRNLQFQLSGIPTASTVTLTAPAASGTIARTSDIPSTFAASAITSGTFDNARINFAAPSNIGTTTPAEINGTTIRTTQGIQAGVIGSYLSLFGSNVRMGSDQVISWNSLASQPSGAFADTVLARDAANVLALRNGTNVNETRIYGTFTSSTNYQRMTIKSVRQTLSALSGASATTTGTFIPDGAVVVGVTTRVATLLTGATGYTIGDGTDADRWGDITGTAIGTTSDNRDWTAGTIECFTAGGNVTLTAKTANFTAGAIEVCVFYLAGEAD